MNAINLKSNALVYEPREDTYLLLRNITINKNEEILEVGTGSGVISIYCAKKGAIVTATDISKTVLKYAKENAKQNGILNIQFIKTDLFPKKQKKFDVIIFNPPYLPLDETGDDKRIVGGKTGWEITDRFLKNVRKFLKENGRVYLLCSSLSMPQDVKNRYPEFHWELLESERFFFEELFVYKLNVIRE